MMVRPGRLIRGASSSASHALSAISTLTALYDIALASKVRVERTGSAATTPAAYDGPVGTVLASIGGNHMTAGADAGRPTLRNAAGLTWLEWDGNDDALAFDATLGTITHAVIAAQTTDADGVFIHHGGIGGITAPHIPVFLTASGAASTTGLTSPKVSVNRGANLTTRAALRTAIAVASPTIITVSFAALASVASPAYGGYSTAASQFRFAHKLYGLALMTSPSAGELASVESFLASRAGITL